MSAAEQKGYEAYDKAHVSDDPESWSPLSYSQEEIALFLQGWNRRKLEFNFNHDYMWE